jgi:hypothetical protein
MRKEARTLVSGALESKPSLYDLGSLADVVGRNLAPMDKRLGKRYDCPRNLSVLLPSPSSTTEQALDIFRAHGGVLKTQTAMNLGIHPRTLYALRDDAILERLDHYSCSAEG